MTVYAVPEGISVGALGYRPVQHKPSQAGWAHPGGSEHVVGRVKGEHFTVENGMVKGKSCCSLYVQQL